MGRQLSQEIIDFLDHGSYKGIAWLATADGRTFLNQETCLEWLISPSGIRWLDSADGKKWVLEDDNRILNYVHEREFELLKNSTIQSWLTHSSSGQHFLCTGHGFIWLKSSEGQKWMETMNGKKYMNVPAELKFEKC